MKKIIYLIWFMLIFSCSFNNQDTPLHKEATFLNKENNTYPYGVKSGIIKYKITITNDELASNLVGYGTGTLFFDIWGNKEIKEEEITKTIGSYDNQQNTKSHQLIKEDNLTTYNVDFNHKIILKTVDSVKDIYKQTNNHKNILTQYGGIKLNNEIINGYNCEVWSINGTKQWLYKGIPLKSQVKIMGIVTTKETISANFNVDLHDEIFDLPNYPIKKNK